VHVSRIECGELCGAFCFALEYGGKLLIYNRNTFSGTFEGAWQ
jgi:hypothetical protein